ncbi:hypothetical protein [Agriterribacter humi]|uniref:hypothetical protein n=1 Tax=Agriterribacter humi TaxID=1104781 RepID=UPI0012656F93|nr:hypothetical protein [Agriterribacter humi]
MPENYHPSVDLDFIEKQLINSGRLAPGGIVKIGSTTTYVIQGNQAIYKRSIYIRELTPGQVCFEQATGLAIRFSFMGALLEWLHEERNWKEGDYVVPKDSSSKYE